MAKKKKTAQPQGQLSPANYIKQKSRSLPIYECFINEDWEEERFANILISRQHNNGNFTVATYLVDLGLLGVKDTTFFFNLSQDHYNDLKSQYFNKPGEASPTEYALVHNIIFSAVAFANDFEFRPHKEFILTTQYFLEEDDDKIELIEVECGVDGLPIYINGPFDNTTRINQILAQLERTAGPEKFYFQYINPEETDDEQLDDLEDDDHEADTEEEWDDAEDITDKK